MKSLFQIFTLFLLCSCRNQQETGTWTLTEDSLAIDGSLLNAKFNVKSDEKGGALLQAYNKAKNEIVVIDLEGLDTLMVISPKIDFDNSGRLIQFGVHKADSIFVITENNIFIVNTGGRIIFNMDLSTPIRNDQGREILFWDNDNQFPLHYLSQTKELIVKTICNCSFSDKEYFQHRLEAVINLETGDVNQLNYSFPQNHRENAYGQSVFPYRVIRDSLHIISFQSNDSLFVYNRNSNRLIRYSGKSRHQSADFIPFDTSYKEDLERMREYLVVSPIYQKLLYDPYKKLYYRFFVKEQPLMNESGVINSIFTKDVILMVINEDFEIIDEKNIGTSYSWFFSFVTPRGLYIRKYDTRSSSDQNPSNEKFTIFSWN